MKELIFPNGDFTQNALADLNGVSKMNVYAKLQEAVKDGTLVLVGKVPAKGGRGKPSNIFRVNNHPAQVKDVVASPVTSPVTSSVEAIPVVPGPPTAVLNAEPVVPQLPVKETPSAEDLAKIIERGNQIPVRAISEKCPVCQHPLLRGEESNGSVVVWCSQKIEVCACAEAPFGSGKTEKDALNVLFNKWHSK